MRPGEDSPLVSKTKSKGPAQPRPPARRAAEALAGGDLESVFAALVHKLAQPLTALRGNLEVAVLEEANLPECRKVLRDALGQAERLSGWVELLREAIESGDPGDEFQVIHWAEAVRRGIEELLPVAKARELKIATTLAEESPVRANPERFFEATLKALRLAVEGSPEGGAIKVSLEEADGDMALNILADGPAPHKGRVAATMAAAQNPSAPSWSFDSAELQWWMLARMIEAQRGTARIEFRAAGRCHMQLRLPRLHSQP